LPRAISASTPSCQVACHSLGAKWRATIAKCGFAAPADRRMLATPAWRDANAEDYGRGNRGIAPHIA
jgi:hypothetical protein